MMSGWFAPRVSNFEKVLAVASLCLLLVLLVGCATDHPEVGTRVIYQTVDKEVPRPCPVTKPVKPAPLARPFPADPARLLDLLAAKLLEWSGPGGYGERADAAITTCTKP